MTTIELETVGLASVQDLGRPGLAHLGVAENGAADGWAARVANVLVGNREDAPLIEVVGSALGFRADTALLLAVTGATSAVSVGGLPQPAWELLVVPAGQPVLVPALVHGLRSYVAIHGVLESSPVLGSVAPDRLLGIGTFLGRGTTLQLRSAFEGLVHPYFGVPVFRLGPSPPRLGNRITVEVTPGPEADEFGPSPLGGRYRVSDRSDAVGLRLDGNAPTRTGSSGIVSRGVPVGAVEVPPGGGLLVLMRGRLVTAGYPVVAVATRIGVDRLGQARLGDIIDFVATTVDEAHRALRRQATELEALRRRVRTAFAAVGLAGLSPAGP